MFFAYFKVYLSKLKILKFEVLSIKIEGFTRVKLGFFALIAESADESGGEKEVVIALLDGRTSRASKIQTKRQELECTSSLLIHL